MASKSASMQLCSASKLLDWYARQVYITEYIRAHEPCIHIMYTHVRC